MVGIDRPSRTLDSLSLLLQVRLVVVAQVHALDHQRTLALVPSAQYSSRVSQPAADELTCAHLHDRNGSPRKLGGDRWMLLEQIMQLRVRPLEVEVLELHFHHV